MNRDQISSLWNMLSDEDLDYIGNSEERLVQRVRQRYGYSLEEAESQVSRLGGASLAGSPGEDDTPYETADDLEGMADGDDDTPY
jgi:hypothetical protein